MEGCAEGARGEGHCRPEENDHLEVILVVLT